MAKIQIDLVSDGSDKVTADIGTIDQALTRSSAAAKRNAAEVEQALSAQIRKREELKRQISETEAALSKSKAGGEEFAKLESQLKDLTKAEKTAATGVRDLSRDRRVKWTHRMGLTKVLLHLPVASRVEDAHGGRLRMYSTASLMAVRWNSK